MALFTRVKKDEDENLNQNYNHIADGTMMPNNNLGSAVEEVANLIAEETALGEGQLAVDVYQNEDKIVIKATIAGVKPEDLDIAVNNENVTIRGTRHLDETISQEDYFYQECYWGDFSRSIILPTEVRAEEAEAILKNGVLTLTLPKNSKTQAVAVKVKGE
ncbi:MAG TPA: Hsp20/alpha crystallin family protein [bacterium]|nr:Hsp20/alpha crystallin family protein [bacterium]